MLKRIQKQPTDGEVFTSSDSNTYYSDEFSCSEGSMGKEGSNEREGSIGEEDSIGEEGSIGRDGSIGEESCPIEENALEGVYVTGRVCGIVEEGKFSPSLNWLFQ